MREILFRGKSKKTNTWVYGYFVESEGICFIYSKNEALRWIVTEVIPESVGQSIGIYNIFENDIILFGSQMQIIKYRPDICAFERIGIQGPCAISVNHIGLLKVVGNTIDNPELIPEE